MITKSNQSLGKKQIVQNIKSIVGFSSKNIDKITVDIIDSIIENLIIKKKINIKNFGSFYIIYKKERGGRNQKTKEEFIINSRNTIKFKVSNYLKKKINEI